MEKERVLLSSSDDVMFRRWHRASLEAKLTFLVLAILVFVLTLISYAENQISIRIVERNLRESASETAATIAAELERGVPDTQKLFDMLSAFDEANEELYDVAVFRQVAGSVLTVEASMRGKAGPSEEHQRAMRTQQRVDVVVHAGGERYLSVAFPVPISDGSNTSPGCIGVWMSLHSVDVLRRQYRNLLLITVPLSIVVLALLVRVVFTRFLHRPLRDLAETIGKVESGELSVETTVARRDEIGLISERFNRMVGRLREAVDEREALLARVNDFNKELSQKVGEATRELEDKNREQQRLNAELYYMQRRLARTERLTLAGQMTATFAHEMGTPLNLISGHIQTLLKKPIHDQKLQEKLGLIYAQAERLTAIIRSMLDRTRTPVVKLEATDLNGVLERVLAAMNPTIVARSVYVEKRLEHELQPVAADESQLEQVFSNLLANSLDAMPRGGTLSVVTEADEDSVRVIFGDTGEGIPEAELPQIFRPLYTTKEIGRGTGLGLAIVKEIITAHGASIRVESELRKGTVFIIEFPLTPAAKGVVLGS
ncbi:MAG: hypothetical protein BMS9Abin37_1831 [Acidobacteriota bacterium]|nr:MAG: hypothetical protein BMS9Abin37_1831 [Acidobacteriota bacterium]